MLFAESNDAPLGRASGCGFNSWAVIGTVTLPLSDAITWKASLFYGGNLDSFWGGVGQGINVGLQREIDALGGWTQLQFKMTDQFTVNLGYAIDNPDDADLPIGGRTKNQSMLINSYYSFNPSVIWGLEYMRQETGYKGSPDSTNDHLQSSLIYKF